MRACKRHLSVSIKLRLLGYHCVPSCNYTYVRAKLCLIGMSTIFTCDFAFARIFSMGFVASAHFYHTFVAGSMINMMRLPTLDLTLLSSVVTCMPRRHHLLYSEVMIGKNFIRHFFHSFLGEPFVFTKDSVRFLLSSIHFPQK